MSIIASFARFPALEAQTIIDNDYSVLLVRETSDRCKQSPKLLQLVSLTIRSRHYSRRTEDSYKRWIKRFILFHGKRHPREMGEAEVTSFLSYLATKRRVSASTQNQALSAILFLYREVLKRDLDWLDGIVRAKKPHRLPVVLTHDEVQMLAADVLVCHAGCGAPAAPAWRPQLKLNVRRSREIRSWIRKDMP